MTRLKLASPATTRERRGLAVAQLGEHMSARRVEGHPPLVLGVRIVGSRAAEIRVETQRLAPIGVCLAFISVFTPRLGTVPVELCQ
jgi:hypothetical protein